jgi:EmrB/QacA subfamily drug resistance transporter
VRALIRGRLDVAPSRPAVTLAAMSVAQLMVMLDATIVQVALPTIRAELDVSAASLAWIVNAYGLVLASLLLTGGALGDRFGRRRVFLCGVALFTAASAACALASDDPQLVAARAVQGLGAAGMAPLSLSILADAFAGPGSTRAIAIWAAMGSVGFGLGPVVGGLLVEHVDWSAIFWVNVPLGVVCAGLCVLGVGESRDPSARALDLPGAALACACLSALVFALLESGQTSWLALSTGGALLASALCGVAFVAWERRTATPMIPLGLLRERSLATALGVTVTAYVALGGLLYLGTLLLQNVRGGSPLQAGAEWVPISVAFGLTALGVARLTRRVGRVNAITAALVLAAVAARNRRRRTRSLPAPAAVPAAGRHRLRHRCALDRRRRSRSARSGAIRHRRRHGQHRPPRRGGARHRRAPRRRDRRRPAELRPAGTRAQRRRHGRTGAPRPCRSAPPTPGGSRTRS